MARIPFGIWPSHWGLKGAPREMAKAHYELEGEALDKRIIELTHSGPLTPEQKRDYAEDMLALDHKYGRLDLEKYQMARLALEFKKSSKDYKLGALDIQYENENIDEYEYDTGVAKINHPDDKSPEYLLAIANIDLKHEKIEEEAYKKRVATIRSEPYVHIVKAELVYDPDSSNQFSFELDWNEAFVLDLLKNGWTGLTPEEIVEQWFTQTCQDAMAAEDFSFEDTGMNSPIATTVRFPGDDNTTEYM